MRMKSWLLQCCTFMLLGHAMSGCCPATAGGASPKERLLRECPQAHERLLVLGKNLRGTAVVKNTIQLGVKTLIDQKSVTFYVNGNSYRLDSERTDDGGTGLPSPVREGSSGPGWFQRSSVSTEKMFFAVERASEGSRFFLRDIKTDGSKRTSDISLVTFLTEVSVTVHNVRLVDLLNDPHLTVDEVTTVGDSPSPALKATFRRSGAKKREIESGWFQVDPGKGWAVDAWGVSLREWGNARGRTTYKKGPGPRVVPEMFMRSGERTGAAAPYRSSLEIDYAVFSDNPLSAENYSLATFGLDYALTPRRASGAVRPVYLLSIAAVLSLAFSALLWRLAKRAPQASE
ncbi:MAG: hypothetical protein ACP5XB_31490 [Isosphaeraceae bacterium]